MDKFDQTIRFMSTMSQEDRSKNMASFRLLCACPACPSYTDCAKNGKQCMFCIMGHNFGCIEDIKGCACGQCQLATRLDISNHVYCVKGSEFEQRYMRTIM